MAIRRALGSALFLLGLGGCANSPTPSLGCNDGTNSSAIIGGSMASSYPEAVLVDMAQGGQLAAACSGSIIAPHVVLTAGHCVANFDGWRITAPFAGNQSVTTTDGETYDWNSVGETVDPSVHDIGLLYLTTPITLSSYPVLAQQPLNGESIVNIGRIQNGSFSQTSLFVSQPLQVDDATQYGFMFDYVGSEIIQSGDSGGPDEIVNRSPHVIVAVNSGAGSGMELLGRVDLLYSWIQGKIQAHGGFVTQAPDASAPPADAGIEAGGAVDGGGVASGGNGGSSSSSGGGSGATGGKSNDAAVPSQPDDASTKRSGNSPCSS